MDQEREFRPVDSDFMFEGTKTEYLPAPTGEPLKFVVAPMEFTEQVNNFKTTPDGKPNPDFGKPQPVLVFKAKLSGNDLEADGQVYSTWITGYYKDGKPIFSMGDRSKLGKLAEAICGSVEAWKATPAGQLIGLPFRAVLQPGKKDPATLVLDGSMAMPPAKGQKAEPQDTVVTDVDSVGEDAVQAAIEAMGGEEV